MCDGRRQHVVWRRSALHSPFTYVPGLMLMPLLPFLPFHAEDLVAAVGCDLSSSSVHDSSAAVTAGASPCCSGVDSHQGIRWASGGCGWVRGV